MAVTIAQATQALNTTLSQLGYDYQLPTTGTDAEILQAFQNVGAFSPDAKSNILMRQQIILVQNIFDSRFNESKNPTRVFWRNDVNYGGGIQDTFIELIEAESGYWLDDYTGTEATDNALAQNIMTDLVKAKLDNVKTKIHTINQRFRLKLTVSDLEVSKVFTPQGYASFLETKYANLANSVEAHFMDIVISQMKDMIANSRTVFQLGYDLNTADGVTTFVEALNTVSDGMQTLNSGYNVEDVRTTSNFEDLYLVVTPDVYNRIKSRGYANAFNLQEYENKNRLIMLPAGTNLGNGSDGKQIGAMLVDRRAVLFSLRYWSTKPFIVSNTDYTNTFVNIQGISGDTGFFQSVAFGTGAVGNFTEPTDIFTYDVSVGVDSSMSASVYVASQSGDININTYNIYSKCYPKGGSLCNVYKFPKGTYLKVKGGNCSVFFDYSVQAPTPTSNLIMYTSRLDNPAESFIIAADTNILFYNH